MTEDDRIDEAIRNAAQSYNRAPAVPRDEMWAAIENARAAGGPRLHVVAGGSPAAVAADRGRRDFGPKFAWWGAAAAAMLLVAAGVGIGRLTSPSGSARSAVNTRDSVAVVPGNAGSLPQVADNVPRAEVGDAAEGIAARTSPDGMIERRIGGGAVRPGMESASRGSVPRVTASGSSARRNGPVPRGLAGDAPGTDTYQVATIRHLADAEALLTSFSLETRDQKMDAQLAGWAKGLLSNTRLLLDSPAGEDARRARLLEDLELVLAQIVQLSPAAAASERELIQGSINNGQVMTRLRTAIPAGPTRGL